ncbi:MAG: hypothetical protein WKF57_16405 [Nakamurella sp.]
MPDPVVPTLGIVADIVFEVDGGGRRTRAHLSGGPGTLVLDVDDPAVLLRSLPRGGGRGRSSAGIGKVLSGTTIQVRSGGSELGSVRFGAGRRPVVRPTGSAVGVVVRELSRSRAVRLVAGALALAVAAVRVGIARRR